MRRALPALLLVAACNNVLGIPEPSHDPAALPADAAVDASNSAFVTGIARTVHVLETSDEIVPAPLGPPGVVEAWIPDPTQTDGFRKSQATVQDGSFSIDQVINGLEYYLRYQPADEAVPTFLVTKSRVLDMTKYTSQRPDVEPASLGTTSVSFSVTGLAPWQQTGTLDVWSWNSGAYLRAPPMGVLNYPRNGDVALANLTVNWFQPFPLADPFNLLDAGAGDRLQVAHMATTKSSTGVSYERLAQIFSPAAVDVNDGVTTMFSGAFTDVELDRSLVIEFQRSLFEYYYYWMGREFEWPPTDFDGGVFIGTLPWGKPLDHGIFPPAPSLMSASVGPLGKDVNVGEVVYGDPFSAGSAEFVGASVRAQRQYSVPAIAPGTNRLSASLQVLLPVDGPGMALAPLVSPGPGFAMSITGNYYDGGFFVLSASGDPLTMEWDLPDLGTADYYILRLYRFYADGSFLRRTPVATFYTPNLTLLVPRTLFEAGSYYVMVQTSVFAPNSDVTRRPFDPGGLPYATADVMSGVIRVAP